MSLLPSFASAPLSVMTTSAMSVPVEYEIDFATGQLTGRKVEGLEAIKVWIWLCLHTERFRYPLYSRDYGVELDQYIGEVLTNEFLQIDSKEEIEEALMINPYITGISNYVVSINEEHVSMSFKADTMLGEVDINV